MALSDDARHKTEQYFKDTLEILNRITAEDVPEYDLGDVTPQEKIDHEGKKYAEWIYIKAELRYGSVSDAENGLLKKDNPNFPVFFGGLYWTYLGTNIGDEINKHRPVVVIRSEKNSNLCTVVPLSTQKMDDGFWYHIDLENDKNTAIVEQLQIISKTRLDKPLRSRGNMSATNTDMINIMNEIKRFYASPPKWFAKEYSDYLR